MTRTTALVIAATMIIAASCGGGDAAAPAESSPDTPATTTAADTSDEADTGDTPATTAAPVTTTADTAAESSNDDTADDDDTGDSDTSDETTDEDATSADNFGWRSPADGEPILIGMVNTEGVPGLDFPEMRTDLDRAVAYLNDHGGLGGRPIVMEHCRAAGSPDSSQACAQTLTGMGVDMVLLGLDIFPGYSTFSAADVPVFGALPILPNDYSADAQFITGGNLTTMGVIAAIAVEHIGARSVGIVSADNIGANTSEADLTAALDAAGIDYVSIKGGDNETDAGFQALIREAAAGSPDLLVSLYADAGCIGAMRGRALLGIDTPAISTAICAGSEVIDVVGDDARGWMFVGVGSSDDSAASTEFEAMLDDGSGDGAGGAGLGALAVTMIGTLARAANALADEGIDVDGDAIAELMASGNGPTSFPNGETIHCGAVSAFPAVCGFSLPVGYYTESGEVETLPGFDSVSAIDYLP